MYLIESYPGIPKSHKSSYYKQKIDDILSTVDNINKYYYTAEDKKLLYLFYLRKILHKFCSHRWPYYMYKSEGRYVDPLAVLKFCTIGYEQAAVDCTVNCNIGSSLSDYTSIEYYYKDILKYITFIGEDNNIVVSYEDLESSSTASTIIKLIKNAYYYCDFDLVSYMLYFDPVQNNGIRFDIYHEYPNYNRDYASVIISENLSKLQKAIIHVAYSDFVDLNNINTIGYTVRRKSLSFIENYYLSIDIPEDRLSYNALNMYEFNKYQNIMNEITLEPNYPISSEEMATEYLTILSLYFGQNAVFTMLNEQLCRRYANATAAPTTKDGILLAYSSKYDIVYNTDRETLLQGKLFNEIKDSDKIVVLREKEEK